MFTGIIEGIGTIQKIIDSPLARRFTFKTPFSLSEDQIGESIAINGCCLTIVEKKDFYFEADISPETLQRTILGNLKEGDSVNLERALRLQDRLGGHLVQGHVDGIGTLEEKETVLTGESSYYIHTYSFPPSGTRYLIEKGSITVNGVSLTVNTLTPSHFSVCLIPHTQLLTTLTGQEKGDRVNLEFDLIAKYIEKNLGEYNHAFGRSNRT